MLRDYNPICGPYGEMAMGAGLDVVGGIFNNLMAKWREDAAREQNYKYNEMAAQNADARTRALYNDLQSPQALLQQYQAAGLSPSLMFGGGGVGGQTTSGAQGEGASGISPTTYGINPLEAANLALVKAQTRKLNAEADTEEGTNARGEAEIKEIKTNVEKTLTEIGLNKIAQNYNTLMVAAQEIENAVAASVQDYKVKEWEEKANYMEWLASRTEYEAENEALEYNFNSDTYETRKDTINAKLENIYSNILRNEFQNKVDEATISKMAADILEISLNYQVAMENVKLRALEGKALVLANKDAATKWRTELEGKVKMWAQEMNLEYAKLQQEIGTHIIDGLFDILGSFTSILTASGITGKKGKK